MTIRINRERAVHCHAMLELGMSATSAWGQLRDFHRYARQDFFHADIRIEGRFPAAGAAIEMTHQFAGVRIRRVGRILTWREGVGYSFSDLSEHGPHRGFPHIFGYRLEKIAERSCRLHILVRGKWTARLVPRWIARIWLAWVFSHMVARVRNELLMYQVWRRGFAAAQKNPK